MKTLFSTAAVSVFLLVSCAGALFGPGGYRFLQKAEEAMRQKDYEGAITLYNKHIQYRLSLDSRPEWENPWFYLLMIGDIELGRGRPAEAVQAYEQAEKEAVDPKLVADRYRFAAKWYEDQGRLQEAFDLLSRHRSLDTILFDIMLDRLSREITIREETAAPAPPVKH